MYESDTDLRRQAMDWLRGARIAVSTPRLRIAMALLSHGGHPTAEELHALLRRQHGHSCRGTVYNTLNLFVARRLVRTVSVDGRRTHFDTRTTPHHHLYNEDTGELMDVPPEKVVVDALPPLPENTRLKQLDLVIRVGR